MNLAALQELAAQQQAARATAGEMAAELRQEFGPRLAWVRLYGSLARGDWLGPDESDIDIAVALHESSPEEVRRVISLAHAASLRGGVVISPRVFSVTEFARLRERELRLARDIAEEGIEL